MLSGNNTLLIFVSLMALGIIMMSVKHIKKEHEIPLILLVAGLIGNLIDRVFRGFVVDFFDFGWWPVFNLADSAIVVGAFTDAGLAVTVTHGLIDNSLFLLDLMGIFMMTLGIYKRLSG